MPIKTATANGMNALSSTGRSDGLCIFQGITGVVHKPINVIALEIAAPADLTSLGTCVIFCSCRRLGNALVSSARMGRPIFAHGAGHALGCRQLLAIRQRPCTIPPTSQRSPQPFLQSEHVGTPICTLPAVMGFHTGARKPPALGFEHVGWC